MASCGRRFEESHLSGYLDGALTQGDEQRVRVHLEDCEACRALVDDMRELRETTMKSKFAVPPDDQWIEAPRSTASRLSAGLGWVLVVVWAVVTAGYGLWELGQAEEPLGAKLLVFAGLSGFALLFVSVLLDRLRARATDRYRGVKK